MFAIFTSHSTHKAATSCIGKERPTQCLPHLRSIVRPASTCCPLFALLHLGRRSSSMRSTSKYLTKSPRTSNRNPEQCFEFRGKHLAVMLVVPLRITSMVWDQSFARMSDEQGVGTTTRRVGQCRSGRSANNNIGMPGDRITVG